MLAMLHFRQRPLIGAAQHSIEMHKEGAQKNCGELSHVSRALVHAALFDERKFWAGQP
jgi:hypothetical protein